jgi:hypothetical protein
MGKTLSKSEALHTYRKSAKCVKLSQKVKDGQRRLRKSKAKRNVSGMWYFITHGNKLRAAD